MAHMTTPRSAIGPGLLRRCAALSLAAAFIILPGRVAESQGSIEATMAQRMLVLVNQARSKAGVPSVVLEPRLMKVAQAMAQDLARRRTLSHEDAEGHGIAQRFTLARYPYAIANEDVAAGRNTPQQTLADWMASPLDRDNILSPAVHDIGIGYVYRPDDRSASGLGYGYYWVIDLGVQLVRSP